MPRVENIRPTLVGEITGYVLERGVAFPSQGERDLRVAWHNKIPAIEQIVSFHSKRNFRPLRQLETLLKC